jgi:pyridoxamine 5'-phosphate oxidase
MVLQGHLLTLCLTTYPLHAFKPSIARHVLRPHYRAMSSDSAGMTDIGQVNNGVTSISDSTTNDMISWKARIDKSIARSRKIRGSNYVQISTVSNGEPRCRTVVFRGFQRLPSDHTIAVECDDIPCVMKMITDNRSNKVSEAASKSAAEMVWWFPKTSEQYRIRGSLVFVGGGDFELDEDSTLSAARKEQWGNLSDGAREQFFWQDPGIPYSGESRVPKGGRDDEGTLLVAPKTFLLMFLLPSHIDYLRLGDNFRQIDELVEKNWVSIRVNP